MAINRTKTQIISGFSGKVGNALLKQYGDKIVLSAIPDMSDRVLSKKQKEANELMKFANMYAQAVTADRELKAEACELLNVPPNKVYKALIKDFMQKKGEDDKLLRFTRTAEAFAEQEEMGHS
ncbi:MAG: hypothetical protein J7497_10975 [Chitinophagaceae bacterium]|nr:hypothetical protein [Chitinophagaceae bacterium]